MNNKLGFLALLVLLSGCFNQESKPDYSWAKEVLGKSLIDHFPESVNGSYGLGVSEDIYNAHPHAWLKIKLSDIELLDLLTHLQSESKASYSSEDSCLLVIDQHLNSKNWRDIDKRNYRTRRSPNKSIQCGEELLPIPKIFYPEMEEDARSATGLVGYYFYVLNAGKKQLLSSEKLTNSAFSPEGWEHGFSKGIAINQKTNDVIYWADVW